MELTECEKEELLTTPAGSKVDMDEEQIKKRLAIAKRLCFIFAVHDHNISSEHRELYDLYPLWGFYVTNSQRPLAKRSFGVMYTQDKKILLQTVTCVGGLINLTAGGTPVEDLTQVDRWPESMLDTIKRSEHGGIFTDPLGFLVLLEEFAPNDL